MYTFLTTLLILDNSHRTGHRTWSKLHLFSFRASDSLREHNWARSCGTQTVSRRFCSQCFSSVKDHRDMTGQKEPNSSYLGSPVQHWPLIYNNTCLVNSRLSWNHIWTSTLRLAEFPFLWFEFDCILVSIIKYSNKPFYTFPSKVVSPVLVGRQTELRWWDRVGSEWD